MTATFGALGEPRSGPSARRAIPSASRSIGLPQWLRMKSWSGKSRDQPQRVRHLPGKQHQVEVSPCAAEPRRGRRARPDRPSGRRRASETRGRIVVPAHYVADADHAIERRLRFDEVAAPRCGQRHMRDMTRAATPQRRSRLSSQRVSPRQSSLAQLASTWTVATTFWPRGSADSPRQIVAPDRRRVAELPRPPRRREPGMPPRAQVPKVVMRHR